MSGIADMDPHVEVLERALQACNAMHAYVLKIIDDHRRHPRDNLMSALIAARDQDDRLTEDELFGICQVLMIAGHETTTGLVGNGLYLLLTHPDALMRLRAEPAGVSAAIEEMLRYDSPVQVRTRMAMDDLTLGGQSIHRGDMLYLLVGAANRDGAQFPDPARFDIARTPNHHLAFGEGIHYCLGSPLARLEGRITINTLLSRLPHLTLQPGVTLEHCQNFPMRLWSSLPVAF